MILRHFKLREQPFGVTPDPRFLLATETHREALAALLYGIESGLGFIALTANPGMGKTTLLFEALGRLRETTRTVFLFQAISSPVDLVRALLIDLGEKSPEGSLVDLETRLNEILVSESESGKRLVVVIDEAQNLDNVVLEAVRMLSNFETVRHKLLQIVLCGQLQLAQKLAQPELLQLRQRISIFARIRALSALETGEYIRHRLKIAGCNATESIFTAEAIELIARRSLGIPRNINNICFNALSLACALNRTKIDDAVIGEVVDDLNIRSYASSEHITVMAGDESELDPDEQRSWFTLSWLRAAMIGSALAAVGMAAGWFGLLEYPALQAAVRARGFFGAPLQSVSVVRAAGSSRATETTTTAQPDRTPVTLAESQPKQRTILVRQGQSLSGICSENFGDCGSELLHKIFVMNSRIPDPNHIEPGQKIVLPVLPSKLADSN